MFDRRRRPLRTASLALVFAALGCATVPSLPEAEAPLQITGVALQQTGRLYLWPDRLDQRVLVGALDALEARFDRVQFDASGSEGVLVVNGASVRVPLDPSFSADEYRV